MKHVKSACKFCDHAEQDVDDRKKMKLFFLAPFLHLYMYERSLLETTWSQLVRQNNAYSACPSCI